MYIKSIVLDGFKSYGHRTEVAGFDKQFNAITGLNGSGKSNILDSICFVLGISNLSHVRVGNLQDLIYKSGQCGINKASVSITFDNRNSEQCPPGFENVPEITITRQIVLGGKSKYMINGSTVQNKKIQDLFCSIQLNVNNPHFLIMQGKVTKVLNMKPAEILGMIEEAAGTKMYEVKKESAEKTIQKKDHKLNELRTVMYEEIEPKLQKLKNERAKFMEYKVVERDLEHMMNVYQAWEYFSSKQKYTEAKESMEAVQSKIQELETNIKNHKDEIKQMDELIKESTKLAEKEGSKNLTKLENELKKFEKSQAEVNAKIKSITNEINNELKKKTQLEKNLADEEKSLKKKESELSKLQPVFTKLKETDEQDTQAFYASQKRYEALSAGMDINDEGEVEGLHEQLFKAREEAAKANTEIKQADMKLKYLQDRIKEKRKQRVSNANGIANEQKKHDEINKKVQSLEASLEKLGFNDEIMNDMQGRKRQLGQDIKKLSEKIDNFEAQRPYTQFRYRDPEPNFNRKSVYGVVCRLIKVKNEEANMAIETAAGGRLYNVVIDTDVTGKKLLQKGDLQQRTTFIPINKIQASKMSNSTIKCAQDMFGKDNVQPALYHLNYDKHLQVVMEYIFGNVFICKDMNIAKQVAFHDSIRRKCVTLDGDVVDPAGTLSGGAPQKGGSVLKHLEDIKNAENELKAKEQEVSKLEAEIKQLTVKQNQYETLKRELDIKQHELNLVKQKLQQTSHYRNAEEIKQMEDEINSLKEKIQNQNENESKWKQKVDDLESKVKNSKGSRHEQLKHAESEMYKLKTKADKSRENWKQKEQDFYTFQLEIEEMKKSVDDIKEKIVACDEEVIQLKAKQDDIITNSKELNDNVKRLQADYEGERNVIASKNQEIQEKIQHKEELQKLITECEIKIKQNDHKLKKLKEDCDHLKTKQADCKKRLKENYLSEAENLSPEAGRELEKKIRLAQDKKVTLGRTINNKAQTHLDQQEKEYNELKRKQKIVELDKKKILQVIKDLDKKKEEILSKAYDQISRDFGSIFSTLLPGANAKLLPPRGKTILQGLEVKVSLGGVWKESLSELSGGQRSLAALSLILAMLLFKPAPLYILDEVDAALDLSHTQNIGNMLRTHFKKSQFIIVSLKDGMFSNANVLFRTQFVDGVSTVTRTVNKS